MDSVRSASDQTEAVFLSSVTHLHCYTCFASACLARVFVLMWMWLKKETRQKLSEGFFWQWLDLWCARTLWLVFWVGYPECISSEHCAYLHHLAFWFHAGSLHSQIWMRSLHLTWKEELHLPAIRDGDICKYISISISYQYFLHDDINMSIQHWYFQSIKNRWQYRYIDMTSIFPIY